MTIVRMKHIRQSLLCSHGAREFFNRHGFDWNDFLTNGIDAQKVIDTGDEQAMIVVEVARGQE